VVKKQVTLLIQGLRVEPWAVSAQMNSLGLHGDVRVRLRPREIGHIGFIELHGTESQSILELLSHKEKGVGHRFVRLLSFLVQRAYGVQLVVAPPGNQEVSRALSVPLDRLEGLFPTLGEHESILVHVTTAHVASRRGDK